MIGPSQIVGERIMAFHAGLLTSEIATIFAEELVAQGGSVTDTFDDGARLFMRAVLPAEQEVKSRDRVQGGVALRATECDVWIHPYVFRQVCSNGAIIARATQTRHIEWSDFSYAAEFERAGAVREAIQICCEPEAFDHASEAMRSSAHGPGDTALNVVLSMSSRLPAALKAQLLDTISHEFFRGADRSRFALMNVVTAVARDAADPEVRWRLEELGGAIPFEAEMPALDRRGVVLTA
jgi:hypothetical protein